MSVHGRTIWVRLFASASVLKDAACSMRIALCAISAMGWRAVVIAGDIEVIRRDAERMSFQIRRRDRHSSLRNAWLGFEYTRATREGPEPASARAERLSL